MEIALQLGFNYDDRRLFVGNYSTNLRLPFTCMEITKLT